MARTFLALTGAVVLAVIPAWAQPNERAVKAGFIPKFVRYVEWPAPHRPRPRQPFELCVIGHDRFGPLLDRAAAQEVVEGHRIVVRRLADNAGSESCHLAFVRGASSSETESLLLALHGRPTLTVTDFRGGSARGMIHFTIADGRVRFLIDEVSASEHGLTISSRLLALALAVRQRRS